MLRASQIVVASLLAISLAACATQAPDLTPPPAKRLDAKSTLEGAPRR